jgi:hypothetical protein
MTGILTPKGVTLLFHFLSSDRPLRSSDFSEIATSKKNGKIWALDAIKGLSENGFVKQVDMARRRQQFKISRKGVQACITLDPGFRCSDVSDGEITVFGATWQVMPSKHDENLKILSFHSKTDLIPRSLVYLSDGDQCFLKVDHYLEFE